MRVVGSSSGAVAVMYGAWRFQAEGSIDLPTVAGAPGGRGRHAADPPRFRRGSAAVPLRFRRGSAPVPHGCRTGSERVHTPGSIRPLLSPQLRFLRDLTRRKPNGAS